MRVRLGFSAAALVAACGSAACGGAVDTGSSASVTSTDAGDAHLGFALGTYGKCSIDVSSEETGWGGSVTLARTGSVLTASYANEPDAGSVMDDFSLRFTATSDTSATLDERQSISGVDAFACAPLSFAKVTLRMTSGALTYDAGVLFLSTVGTVDDVEGKAPCRTGDTHVLTITCTRE